MKGLKGRMLNVAMKAMSSDVARKIMASPGFQNAMSSAVRTTFKVRGEIDGAKKRVAGAFNLVTHDEIRELRRSVERLERRMRKSEKKAQKAD